VAQPVSPIPAGFTSLTPYLIVHDCAAALAWYAKAFGAKEHFRFPGPDGRIGHAEVQLGNAHFMLADEFPEMMAKSPKAYGGSPMNLMVYLEDVDAAFAQAVGAGGVVKRPVQDQFYGVLVAGVRDSGRQWRPRHGLRLNWGPYPSRPRPSRVAA
jgi:PhnB protein